MLYTGQKKYWLDIRHQPITLYAFTDKPTHFKPPLMFSCGTRYVEAHPIPREVGLQILLAEFWNSLRALISNLWQALAIGLAVISCLSLRQLLQERPGRSDA